MDEYDEVVVRISECEDFAMKLADGSVDLILDGLREEADDFAEPCDVLVIHHDHDDDGAPCDCAERSTLTYYFGRNAQ